MLIHFLIKCYEYLANAGFYTRGDYPGYVPLVTGGHLKISFLISYAEVKRIKYCYRYMIIVIRKHTRQAPKHLMSG